MKTAIVGSTASGKSSLAMAAAKLRPGLQLIAVDSMQVYRGMNIGTAKPTPNDQAAVVHHCIDLAPPSEDFTVVRFVEAYDAAVHGIEEEQNQELDHRTTSSILLVAGTGLYLRALMDRFDPPGEWLDIRADLEADPDLAGLYRRLENLDPIAAKRIDPGNRRRITRALEVCIGSGCSFSSHGPGMQHYPESDIAQVGLRWDRDALRQRVDRRVDDMMAEGFLDEVAAIGRLAMSRTAAQALGYRELLDYLDGAFSLDEAVAMIKQRTRQFAVRQERWFRRDPRIRWVDVASDSLEALPALLETLDRHE